MTLVDRLAFTYYAFETWRITARECRHARKAQGGADVPPVAAPPSSVQSNEVAVWAATPATSSK